LLNAYESQTKRRLTESAQLACWIANNAGWRTKPLRVTDLVRFTDEAKAKDSMTRKDIEELAAFHKKKFWTKLKDQYAKKQE